MCQVNKVGDMTVKRYWMTFKRLDNFHPLKVISEPKYEKLVGRLPGIALEGMGNWGSLNVHSEVAFE